MAEARAAQAPLPGMHLSEGQEPPRSYRPPDGPELPVDDLRNGPRKRPRIPWTGRDMAAAVVLNITILFVVIFAAEVLDAVREDGEELSPLGLSVAAAATLGLSVAVAAVSRLRLAPLMGVITAATALVLAVRQASTTGTGEGELLGLPVGFIESAIFSSIFMATAWLYSGVKYGAPVRDLGFVRPASPVAYLQAIGVWLIALIGIGIWSVLTADVEALQPPDNATEALKLAGGSIVPAWLLVGLLGPFAEEVFFRGFLLNGMLQRLKGPVALVLSAAVFAIFHIDPGLYVPTFLLGLALGWVYLKTRSIWPSIFMHALHNTLVIIATWQEFGTNV
jgi:membrane protease YdiL (CAAX protease family)